MDYGNVELGGGVGKINIDAPINKWHDQTTYKAEGKNNEQSQHKGVEHQR